MHCNHFFFKYFKCINLPHIYGCSNVAKLFEKKIVFFTKNFHKNSIFLRKKKLYFLQKLFTKILFFSVKIFFFQIKLCIQNKYLYPLSKNLILLKFILFKQTHSVKDEFYFQFSFATNEQV